MPTCFVIQPFDEENDRRYEEVYKPALEDAAVTPYRVDRDPSVAVPIDSIESNIRAADIFLADITTHNPNVWYELGFAFATGRPVVMICDRAAFTKLPFDIQHRLVVKYSTASPTDFERLRTDVTDRIVARLRDVALNEPPDADSAASGKLSGELSHEATVVLKAAALADGRILYTTHMGTPSSSVQVGGRPMIPDDADHRTEVAWTGALRELEALNYIRDLGAGTVFELTPAGYATADALLPQSTQHRVWMELNRGEDPGGSLALDTRALSIIEKHGGQNAGGGWRFPDGSLLPERHGRVVAS